MRKLFAIFISFFLFAFLSLGRVEATSQDLSGTEVHIFASQTCPHCAKAKEFLLELKSENPDITIYHYDIAYQNNTRLLSSLATELGITSGAVPLIVIGDDYLLGYSEAYDDQIIEMLKVARDQEKLGFMATFVKDSGLIPVVEKLDLQAEKDAEQDNKSGSEDKVLETDKLKLPVFGEIDLKKASLPIVTFMIALVDGFNPCAMWVLMFLISLLLGMKDRKRMWLLGLTFIAASAFIYFLFMVAWLNLFLFIGFITWVRVAIGLVSLIIAYLYLKDFRKNKDGACEVDLGGKKQKIFSKLKKVSHKENLILAILGIIVLAFAVNLLELVCSAGLPTVYTQLLSMSDLSGFQYYLYLLFYILIFMLDDMIVFVIAMKTLHTVGIDGKYSRFSHLIGGILMLFLGLAMIFKPELIMFG
jgi:glutaredoxin